MKGLAGLIAALLAAVALAVVVAIDTGYVVIGVGHWVVETSAVLAALLLGLLYIALAIVLRVLARIIRFPGRVRLWRARRHHAHAARDLARGLTLLSEGRWEIAEQTLLKHVAGAEHPLLHHLGAAHAAHHQQAWQRRDLHLLHGQQSDPESVIAVGLTQGRMLCDQGECERARAVLLHLRGLAPKHPEVLRALREVGLKLNDWKLLAELAGELRRYRVIEEADADTLAAQAEAALLTETCTADSVDAMMTAFDRLPRELRQHPLLAAAIARLLVRREQGERAEPIVREALQASWSDELAALYGDVVADDADRQLARAEVWLRDHPRHPVLLLALGKICIRARLWGKARIYIESSLGIEQRPDTLRELGALLEHLGDGERALETYRKGLALAVNVPERHALLKERPDPTRSGRYTATTPRLPRDPNLRRSG